ncbi:MAG: sulfite exporter TauE/SafE family protein [Bacteroidota bacterium]|nr:sulfite exporter TauE/SafE family protein [Bacteroidota bacterium]|tara:strand:+ start:174 stop:596 length:423 start_codon:yes stop_codon:yes gene_type:complete
MEITTFITLLFIGLFAGIASGYVGIGGGIIIIPSLIYFLGLGQHQAQGVSLALMLPPIGVLAFYKYFQSGSFNLEIEGQIVENKLLIYALIMAIFFVIGGWLGAKWSLKTPVHIVKLVFGSFMLYASIKMILSGINHYLK